MTKSRDAQTQAVEQCAHHCGDKQYCALSTVQIGTHESNPTEQKCVDCQSFKRK
ncbi:MAG: DUF1540 domain-containing protein [Campylobacter sp.]|nr:DUF1540 domain-containing protein [Campylobacter sp.]